jgi:carbon storage regulator
MLVLSRKAGEEVVIGNDIRIKVVEIQGGKVRIGIVAPEEVAVDRQEIHEKQMDPGVEWVEPEFWSYSCQEMS